VDVESVLREGPCSKEMSFTDWKLVFDKEPNFSLQGLRIKGGKIEDGPSQSKHIL
jgi:hypothetical protein